MSTPLNTALPIVAAPMAGGPTTPALASAVIAAGGFAFLPGGYQSVAAMRAEVDAVRAADGRDRFGVNLFSPARDGSDGGVDPALFAAYAEELAPEAAAVGVELDPTPVGDDDAWPEKLASLIEDPVPVVSLTFGLPAAAEIARLRRAGTMVLATVTGRDEARAAVDAGVDGLVVQGPRAGGHSATFDPSRAPGSEPTEEIVAAVRAVTSLPFLAAGGVDGPEAVTELLAAGAEGVVVGTLLLAADEAGTSAVHRAALADPRFTETTITRAFTGRPARALRNGFIDRHEAAAPVGYPAVHHLTRALRQAAARAGDPELVHLWAGTGHRGAVPAPAAQIVRDLAGFR
ncbi:MAG: nitronate monooxygenase [Nocardioides sp.]|uniref:NAD(P)H-dependent flavin oxidoreductase n=1 Tax=Nocardioides sp. TaxID=35761 RepID=UPI0039E6BBCD